ncbi:asparagine--tRNA ligase [Thermogymnomonas acidicola]|nr:asparagine--tRNA ligase [Thermogymnomonas acidicola]
MTHISELLNDDSVGKRFTIRGWVYRIRSTGKLTFVVMRDSTGIIQVLARGDRLDENTYKEIEGMTVESSCEFTGTVRKDERAVTGYEMDAESFRLYHRNENFPITRDKGEEFLLDNRHLWLRSREMTSVLKVRSTIFRAYSDFFYENGFYQVQAPMMVSTAVEGGSTLFKVPFFDEEVNLTQSSQFYLETMIFSLENVFTLAPSFRAEKSRTRRHLTEYWHGEAECAWVDNSGMMDIEERMIVYIVKRVLEENSDDLAELKRDVSKLEKVKQPFPRVRYAELMKMAAGWGLGLKYGDDLGADEERAITVHFDRPVFVTHYPASLKAFYHRPDPENPSEVLCHDLLAPEGYGEIIGGGERIWELDVLLKRMEENGLRPEDYYWYIDLRRYGSVPHSGFGLGMDRLAMWVMGLDHIRDAIPYPRTVRRTRP